MNTLDIIIIVLLIIGAIVGAKRGFTKQLVSSVGFIVVVVFSFLLKNLISVFLYEHLPFFPLAGFFKGVTVLNIFIYEVIAFIAVFIVLMIIWRLLIVTTSIFEKILNATIILGIPSKIMGAILGILEIFIWVFIGLYILALPCFSNSLVDEVKLGNKILHETPILSKLDGEYITVIKEFKGLKDEFRVNNNVNEFNLKTLDLFLKYDIVTVDSIDVLTAKDKLHIKNIDIILKKYR
ncbi:MAG: CvpA family protein [Bacilli bacterium]